MKIEFFERMESATAKARDSNSYTTIKRMNMGFSVFTQYVVFYCKAVDIPSEVTNTVLHTLFLIRNKYSLEEIAKTRKISKEVIESNHYAILLKYNILPYFAELSIPTELYYALALKIANLYSSDEIFKLKLTPLVEEIEGANYYYVRIICADIYRKLKYGNQFYIPKNGETQSKINLPVPKTRVNSFVSKMLSGNLEITFLRKYRDSLDWLELTHNPDSKFCEIATLEFSV